MKLSCCSRSFAHAFARGALTQLEWVDRCAQLALDGVEFAASHFPRTDSDYLAQLKKLCADRGLTVAAVCVDAPFGAGDVERDARELSLWIDRSVALGAPLVRFSCGAASGSPGVAWRELVRGLKVASAAAKEQNVTLALEAKAATQVADATDLKRAIKECDSAWLRWAAFAAQFEGDAWRDHFAEAVLVVAAGTGDEAAGLAAARDAGYIGFVTIESSGADESAAFSEALRRLR